MEVHAVFSYYMFSMNFLKTPSCVDKWPVLVPMLFLAAAHYFSCFAAISSIAINILGYVSYTWINLYFGEQNFEVHKSGTSKLWILVLKFCTTLRFYQQYVECLFFYRLNNSIFNIRLYFFITLRSETTFSFVKYFPVFFACLVLSLNSFDFIIFILLHDEYKFVSSACAQNSSARCFDVIYKKQLHIENSIKCLYRG